MQRCQKGLAAAISRTRSCIPAMAFRTPQAQLSRGGIDELARGATALDQRGRVIASFRKLVVKSDELLATSNSIVVQVLYN